MFERDLRNWAKYKKYVSADAIAYTRIAYNLNRHWKFDSSGM